MSFFRANNEAGAYANYYQRILYRDNAYPKPPLLPKPIDFWYEKTLYGRVDPFGSAIFPNDTYLKKLPSFEGNIYALDFVVDAYTDLKAYYAIAANTGKVRTSTNTNLATLEPVSGWKSTNVNYYEYMKSFYQSFGENYMNSYENQKKLLNFDSYLKVFMELIHLNTPSFPFTKTGYVTSRWCDPATSGLIIELANEDFGDDTVKYTQYISDPNYIFFAYAAQKYGFKIDKNAPWRLVADLSSPVMRKYMKNYPQAPQLDRPPIYPYYYGDIVEVLTLNIDPTIQGEEYVDDLKALPNVKFRVSEVVPTRYPNGAILYRLFLTPVSMPTTEIDVTTGVLYKKLQNVGILVDPNDPEKIVKLDQSGAGRVDNENKKSEYDLSISNYLQTPKLSIDNIFFRRYYKTYLDDIDILKVHVLEFYNTYVRSNPQFVFKASSCSKQAKVLKNTILREQLSPLRMNSKYKDDFWLNMYAKIRIAETDLPLTDHRKKEILNKTQIIYQTNGKRSALEYINNIFNTIIFPKKRLTPPAKDAKIFFTEGLETLYDGDVDV